jgi:predicted nucleic acid-binding protein
VSGGKPFLDTNILVYAFVKNDPRCHKALVLLAGGGVISVQVLNEFVAVSRRKLRFDWTEVTNATALISTLVDPPMPMTMDLHEDAVAIAHKHMLSFYDGLIIAAAARAGCPILYSEDMQDGRSIAGLTIRNPFAHP